MAAAWPQHMALATSNKNPAAGPKLMQAGHGQPDAAGAAATEQGIAERPQQASKRAG